MTTEQLQQNTNQNIDSCAYDEIIGEIADYVMHTEITATEAYQTMRYCLVDSLGCAMLALKHDDCRQVLGSIMTNNLSNGVTIPGTDLKLDPINAAFSIGAMIRWLDYNDTWLAKEWGHPSDNFAAIISLALYLQQNEQKTITYKDVLTAAIKAYEIQGILALSNCFNAVGLDHVVLVKIASAAVCTKMWGGDVEQIKAVISHAFVDGQALRTYRHAPNTGARKSWAAADASSRALHLSWLVMKGKQVGIPKVLSAAKWGFADVCMHGQAITLAQPLASYVSEHILFKISFPAEFHAQTAVECAVRLHPDIKDKLDDIEKIVLTTQEPAIRIISKTGPLHNFADRDHCLQYMVAIEIGRASCRERV